MSEVHARSRSISQYEFYNTALKIYVEVSRLAHSEKVIPKAWRFTHAQPLMDMARSLVYNINRSDQFFPNTAHNVQQRRDYLTLAVADAEQLAVELGLLPQLLPVHVGRFQRIADLVESEIALLKGARKNVRLVGRQSVEQRISGLEEQIAELRALS